MKILIATRNKDKFKLLTSFLTISIFKNDEFYSLSDIDEEIIDKTEVGDITTRAYDKAYNVYENLKNNYFDLIIGVDDGIEINGVIDENVKLLIKGILNDEVLKEDDVVYITRAYTFISKAGKHINTITKIPFKYKPLKVEFKVEENSFPLNNVLCPINCDNPLIEISKEVSDAYHVKYSLPELNKVLEYFEI